MFESFCVAVTTVLTCLFECPPKFFRFKSDCPPTNDSNSSYHQPPVGRGRLNYWSLYGKA